VGLTVGTNQVGRIAGGRREFLGGIAYIPHAWVLSATLKRERGLLDNQVPVILLEILV